MPWVSFLNAMVVYITFSMFYMEFFFLMIFSSLFNQDSNPLSLLWGCICLGQCYDLPFYLHYSVFHTNFYKNSWNHWIYQYCPLWFLLLLYCLRNSFLYSVHKDVVLYFHHFFLDHFKSLHWIYCSIVSVLSFDGEACGILAPWPGVQSKSPALAES